MSDEQMIESVFASLCENMRKATESFNLMARHFQGAEKEEVQSWPVYADGNYIMCGKDDCPCDMEGEIVLSPGEGDPECNFNMTDLYDAIEAHIVWTGQEGAIGE